MIDNKISKFGGRIDYIDASKGIGIMLVVLGHLGTSFFWSSTLIYSFHMPLFFFLSGIFFRRYDSHRIFLSKKIHSLIIPFMWFYLVTSILVPIAFNTFYGIDVMYYIDSPIISQLIAVYIDEIFPNPPIWFLISLFEVSIIYYILNDICEKHLSNGVKWIIVFSVILGLVGCLLSIMHYNFPLYIDTSLTMMPFFALAHYVYSNRLIQIDRWYSNKTVTFIMVVAIVILGRYVHFDYRINEYNQITLIYPLGFLGIYLTLVAAYKLRKNVILNYWGKNSIIILCTHFMIIESLQHCIDNIIGNEVHLKIGFAALIFILTMIIESIVIIPLFNKYLPFTIGKK